MSSNRCSKRLRSMMALMLTVCMTAGMTLTAFAEPVDSDPIEPAEFVESVEPTDISFDQTVIIYPDELADYGLELADLVSDGSADDDTLKSSDGDFVDAADNSSDNETWVVREAPETFSVESDELLGDAPGTGAPPIQNNYSIKEDNHNVNYYLVQNSQTGDVQFSESQVDFYRSILCGNMHNVPGLENDPDSNLWDTPYYYWRKIAAEILRKYWGHSYGANYLSDRLNDAIGGDPNTKEIDYTVDSRLHDIKIQEWSTLNNSMSLRSAEQSMLECLPDNPISLGYGHLETSGEWVKTQPVLWHAIWGNESDWKSCYLIGIMFSDFKVKPILPENKNGNYVSKTVTTVDSDEVYAADWENDSPKVVNGNKTFEETNSTEITSTINGSTGYEFSEAISIGAEYGFAASKVAMTAEFSSTQSVQKGWEEGTAHTDSRTINHSISADLDPYTGVLMRQPGSIRIRRSCSLMTTIPI